MKFNLWNSECKKNSIWVILSYYVLEVWIYMVNNDTIYDSDLWMLLRMILSNAFVEYALQWYYVDSVASMWLDIVLPFGVLWHLLFMQFYDTKHPRKTEFWI